MKKLYIILCVLLLSNSYIYAFTWEDCIEKYEKAKQFSENTRLSYIYMKSTKNCLIKFKKLLMQDPDPDFTVKAMSNNILMLDKNINKLLPQYHYPKNHLEDIPRYININSQTHILNKDYTYIKKFKDCNGIHAQNKIYTAKHCNIKKSENIHHDLSYIKANKTSNLKIAKINLKKEGTFKYYSMSKVGMFYNTLLQEEKCKFYEAKNTPKGINTSLDLADLSKEKEIRSTCLAIPSNSGGGVFQDNKLVGIISKTVFDKNKFLYSVIETIIQEN